MARRDRTHITGTASTSGEQKQEERRRKKRRRSEAERGDREEEEEEMLAFDEGEPGVENQHTHGDKSFEGTLCGHVL